MPTKYTKMIALKENTNLLFDRAKGKFLQDTTIQGKKTNESFVDYLLKKYLEEDKSA